MILKILILLSFLQNGGYRERVKAEHYLKLSPITYEACKHIHEVCDDPEVEFRIKRVAIYKWKEETKEKYEQYGHSRDELQKKDFEFDWRLR